MRRLLYFLLLITFSQCCKKEQPNPCESQRPVSADFKVYEKFTTSNKDPEYFGNKYAYKEISDTFWRDATFEASEENAKYTWNIGSETYNTKKVSLEFLNTYPRSVIPIELIVEKEPNTSCFPNDDGRDTFTKDVTVLLSSFVPNWYGTYQYNNPDNPGELLQFEYHFDSSGQSKNTIEGLPPDLKSPDIIEAGIMGDGCWKQTMFLNNTIRYTTNVSLVWKNGNQFDVIYQFADINVFPYQYVTKKFRATKLN